MPILFEELRQLLIERLLILGGGQKYNQVCILAGGAGSGKGHVVNNLIGGDWKVYDPDALKFMLVNVAKNIEAIRGLEGALGGREQVAKSLFGSGTTNALQSLLHSRKDPQRAISGVSDAVSKLNLKDPKAVTVLHDLVKNMGLDDKQMFLSLVANIESDHKPNILLDKTMKNPESALETIKTLMAYGYKPENIHIVWVLADYRVAIDRNHHRDRRVFNDILLDTHMGAKKTMTEVVFKDYGRFKINGDVAVVMNDGKERIPRYIRVKKAGKAGFDEKGVADIVRIADTLAPRNALLDPHLAAKYSETQRK
jgi:hypothetical protein